MSIWSFIFESFSKTALTKVLDDVRHYANHTIKLVVITGGEPFLQHIEHLCQGLIDNGFNVQIETNGTIYRNVPESVKIICSPKQKQNGYYKIREDMLERITAFKFLISATLPGYDAIPELGQLAHNIPVYVQPIDEYNEEKNKNNLELAIKLSLKHNYNLSLQLHKFMGIK